MTTEHKYFTTPIYYASGEPHAGHLYATLLMNILKAHYEHRGMQTLSLTGMDEHGEKVAEAAQKRGLTPQAYVDGLAEDWKKVFDSFGIHFDVFLRTTDKAHEENVKRILTLCYEKGDIYFGEHEGHYCVDCEDFLSLSAMDDDKNCLVHKKKTRPEKEANYFFRITKYKDEIAKLIREGKIVPQKRYANEVLSMLESLDRDLSISRPKSRLEWGIEIPFDKNHVTYVWFDALPNYVTGIGGADEAKTSPYWANCTHVLGKDILKFHAIYWPAMLLSLGLPLPTLLVTGWILSGGHKMSKSLGNVIGTEDIHTYGRDAFVNVIYRASNPGEDLDLTLRSMLERYNSDLANGIGNLLSRTLGMIEKYQNKTIPTFHREALLPEERELARFATALPGEVSKAFDEYRLSDALQKIWELIAKTDRYIAEQKPWSLLKEPTPEKKARLENILAHSVAVIRTVGYLALAFFPLKMKALLEVIGEPTTDLGKSFQRCSDFYGIKTGHVFNEIPRLFERMDVEAELAKRAPAEVASKDSGQPAKQTKPAKEVPQDSAHIQIGDFNKVDLRVATVINAEIVDGSDKLLRLKVQVGELGARHILSGIRQWVKPEELVNRKVVIVVNLAPRKMKFGTSEGMLLSAEESDGALRPVFVSEAMKEGARLS